MIPSDNHTRDFMSHPFIEAICGNETAAPLKTLAKRWFLEQRLAPSVDCDAVESFAQDGIRPQRITETCRPDPDAWTTGTDCVGAML